MSWKGNRREIGEDFFETPECAVKAVRKYIPENAIIWECTYGKGALVKGLKNKIMKTDKYPKTDDTREFDFLTDEPDFDFDFLYFNPPWSLKTDFLEKAVSYNKPFLFICPITIMETAKRSKIFHDNQLSIINLSNRVNYVGKSGNKVFFHSIWVLNDGKGKIYYEELVKNKSK